MGRKVKQISGYTSEEIKALFNKEDKYKIGLRLYAVYQVSLGKPSRQLEELYNTSFKQILNWVDRFEKEGVDGLKDKSGRGRKAGLSNEELAELKEIVLEKSPTEFGYNSETWSGPIVLEVIKKQYKIEYKIAQVYNILKKMGLSYQKSKGYYPEADKEKQELFKNGLKKTS
jgi:transposase